MKSVHGTYSILGNHDYGDYFYKKGETINADEITQKVGLPCFVKPNATGSSFGISKVMKKEDLEGLENLTEMKKEDLKGF